MNTPAAVIPTRLMPSWMQATARLVPCAEHARHGCVAGGGNRRDRDEHADQRGRLARGQRQHAGRTGDQGGDQREPARVVDELGLRASGDVAGSMRPPARASSASRAVITMAVGKPDQQRDCSPAGDAGIAQQQRDGQRCERPELRTDDHRADHGHRRVGDDTDPGEDVANTMKARKLQVSSSPRSCARRARPR